MQALWMWAGGAFAGAAFSAWMDWRDRHRKQYDRVALVPWTGLQVMALLLAVMLAGAALVAR